MLETEKPHGASSLPSLIRFIVVIAILAGIGYAALWALATLVEPTPREMSVTIPPNRLPSR
jgi:hypothetical protein